MARYKFKAKRLWSFKTFMLFNALASTYRAAGDEMNERLETFRDGLQGIAKEGMTPAGRFASAAIALFDWLFQRRG